MLNYLFFKEVFLNKVTTKKERKIIVKPQIVIGIKGKHKKNVLNSIPKD